MHKRYISANELLQDAFRLGLEVYRSGFRPDLIVGVWRGGAPVGIAVQEILHLCGVVADHIAIRTSSYRGIGDRQPQVKVIGTDYLLEVMQPHHGLLIVDDVFDTGLSLAAVLGALRRRAGARLAGEIRVATPWYKPANRRTDFEPHYYLRETADWLVFPHELEGLSAEELSHNRPEVRALLREFGL